MTSIPVIDLACPHCGGTRWREARDGSRFPTTTRFTCDDCATKREARQPAPAPAVDWRAHCERVVRERDDALRALDATRTTIEILELRIANLLAPEH